MNKDVTFTVGALWGASVKATMIDGPFAGLEKTLTTPVSPLLWLNDGSCYVLEGSRAMSDAGPAEYHHVKKEEMAFDGMH